MNLKTSNKILCILFYYERPKLVQNFLWSYREQTYKNSELVFIDDSRDESGFQALYDIVGSGRWGGVKYIHTKDTTAQKEARGGSLIGKFANEAMLQSDADIVIIGCDDDALQPDYFEKLNEFYTAHSEVQYSYCDAVTYDCTKEDWRDKIGQPPSDHFINQNHQPHLLGNSKDSSQVSWRISAPKVAGCFFKFPLTACLDFFYWNALWYAFGPGVWNGITGVIKNYSPIQLGCRGNTYGGTE